MPQGSTFLDELSRLNQQNFLGGLAEGAQALKEKVQQDTLVDTYNKFRAKTQGLTTTSDFMSDFNKELSTVDMTDAEKATAKFAELSAKALNNMVSMNQKNQELTNVYTPTIASLAAIGTPEALNVAKTLSNELVQKKSDLESQVEAPLKALEYSSKVLDVTRNVLNIKLSQVALDEAKKKFQDDKGLQDLLVNIMKDPDGQQLFRWGTGAESIGTVLKDDPKVKEVTDRLYAKYSNNPLFTSAITLMAGGKNFYRRSVLMPSASGTGTQLKDDDRFLKAFSSLQDDSKLWDNIHTADDSDYPFGAAKQIILGTKKDGKVIPPTGLENIQDPTVRSIVQDYVASFMTTGERNYNKRFAEAQALANRYGKKLGFDFVWDKYGISGKDILYFDGNNKPIYEPYLYHKGYYNKQTRPQQQQQNLFSPHETTSGSTVRGFQ